jgi:hypothetical protein
MRLCGHATNLAAPTPADLLHQQLGVGGLALDVADAAEQLRDLARRDAQVLPAARLRAGLLADGREDLLVDGADLGGGAGAGRGGGVR